eukprot:CAMPEP_0119415906 /NCGR_PEP_ID=MMETSP1335-20130426/10990_1 /TAXON_ID=259385 /ORGANISM="Chrysoculter rhomboideus, Strain RCC1486" /LENGTH=73 /DNA_ID=CAMNT_0007440967 /DNA_START=218 /DNA_END=439 /DNA_ORIENTATION=-
MKAVMMLLSPEPSVMHSSICQPSCASARCRLPAVRVSGISGSAAGAILNTWRELSCAPIGTAEAQLPALNSRH